MFTLFAITGGCFASSCLYCGVHVFCFFMCSALLIIVCFFVRFLLIIVLSVLRFAASDYPFGVLKTSLTYSSVLKINYVRLEILVYFVKLFM
jgi:hypothetical protein